MTTFYGMKSRAYCLDVDDDDDDVMQLLAD